MQTDGTGWCWGDNHSGAVGDGSAVDGSAAPVYSPVQLPGSDWTHIITSGLTSCGVHVDGSGWCWGSLPGDGGTATSTPTQVPGSWSSFAAAHQDTGSVVIDENVCGVQTDHTGWCWGGNDMGQLGIGTISPFGTRATSPVQIPGSWTSLTTNSFTTCGTRPDHTAACWGRGDDGLVGNGTSGSEDYVLSPATLPGTWTSIQTLTYDGTNMTGIQADATGWRWGWYFSAVQNAPVELPYPVPPS